MGLRFFFFLLLFYSLLDVELLSLVRYMLQRANIISSELYCKTNAVSKGLICNYFLLTGVKYLIFLLH